MDVDAQHAPFLPALAHLSPPPSPPPPTVVPSAPPLNTVRRDLLPNNLDIPQMGFALDPLPLHYDSAITSISPPLKMNKLEQAFASRASSTSSTSTISSTPTSHSDFNFEDISSSLPTRAINMPADFSLSSPSPVTSVTPENLHHSLVQDSDVDCLFPAIPQQWSPTFPDQDQQLPTFSNVELSPLQGGSPDFAIGPSLDFTSNLHFSYHGVTLRRTKSDSGIRSDYRLSSAEVIHSPSLLSPSSFQEDPIDIYGHRRRRTCSESHCTGTYGGIGSTSSSRRPSPNVSPWLRHHEPPLWSTRALFCPLDPASGPGFEDEGAIVASNSEDTTYRTQHGGLFKCERCKKTFRRINAYNRHLDGANCRGMHLVAGDLDVAGNDMTPKLQDTFRGPFTGSNVGGIDMQTTFNPNPLVSHGTDADRDTLLIGENHENVSTHNFEASSSTVTDILYSPEDSKTAATVTSNVLLANAAFMRVVMCFDTLQSIMGLCGRMPSDFAVEVGFVKECRERTQGVYLYCRNKLDEKSRASLVELFHPFPYTILPLPDGNPSSFGDGDVICSSLLQDTGGDQDKGVGQPNMGNYGGSSSGGNTSREGKDHSGSEDDTSGNGNDDRGRPSGGPPSEPPGGGGGQDSQNRKLRGDFESTAIYSITEPECKEIQRFKMRANIVLEIEITEQSAEISATILELSIKTNPDQPFLLDHYVIEMLPGSNAENVSNARPKNRVGEANTINQTTELSGSATLSANPSAVVGGRRAIQEDILRHPIRFKYHENPGDFISSRWEFCVEDTIIQKGQLDLESGHRLLPATMFDEPIRQGATPLESIRELHPMTVHIACFYTKGQFESRWLWFSRWKKTAGRVGWRNFCHETIIVMPIADWPNAKKLYRLPIDVPLSDDVMESNCTSEICNHLQDGPPGLIFSTSALNKSFVATTDFPAYPSPPRSER